MIQSHVFKNIRL